MADKAPNWATIQADPDYQKAGPAAQMAVRRRFLANVVAKDPAFQAASDADRKATIGRFLQIPTGGTQDQGNGFVNGLYDHASNIAGGMEQSLTGLAAHNVQQAFSGQTPDLVKGLGQLAQHPPDLGQIGRGAVQAGQSMAGDVAGFVQHPTVAGAEQGIGQYVLDPLGLGAFGVAGKPAAMVAQNLAGRAFARGALGTAGALAKVAPLAEAGVGGGVAGFGQAELAGADPNTALSSAIAGGAMGLGFHGAHVLGTKAVGGLRDRLAAAQGLEPTEAPAPEPITQPIEQPAPVQPAQPAAPGPSFDDLMAYKPNNPEAATGPEFTQPAPAMDAAPEAAPRPPIQPDMAAHVASVFDSTMTPHEAFADYVAQKNARGELVGQDGAAAYRQAIAEHSADPTPPAWPNAPAPTPAPDPMALFQSRLVAQDPVGPMPNLLDQARSLAPEPQTPAPGARINLDEAVQAMGAPFPSAPQGRDVSGFGAAARRVLAVDPQGRDVGDFGSVPRRGEPAAPAQTPEPATPAPAGGGSSLEHPAAPLSLATDPAALTAKTWYHGTGTEGLTPDSLSTHATKVEGLFGHGVYLTDNPGIAEGYANAARNRKGNPTVYGAKISHTNALNLDEPMPAKALKVFLKVAKAIDPSVHKAVKEAVHAPGSNGQSVYKAFSTAISEYSHAEQVPSSELIEHFQDLSGDLREAGYDAYTHTGGARTGHEAHQVMIMLDPNDELGEAGTALKETGRITHFSPVDVAEAKRAHAVQAPAGGASFLERTASSLDQAGQARLDAARQTTSLGTAGGVGGDLLLGHAQLLAARMMRGAVSLADWLAEARRTLPGVALDQLRAIYDHAQNLAYHVSQGAVKPGAMDRASTLAHAGLSDLERGDFHEGHAKLLASEPHADPAGWADSMAAQRGEGIREHLPRIAARADQLAGRTATPAEALQRAADMGHPGARQVVQQMGDRLAREHTGLVGERVATNDPARFGAAGDSLTRVNDPAGVAARKAQAARDAAQARADEAHVEPSDVTVKGRPLADHFQPGSQYAGMRPAAGAALGRLLSDESGSMRLPFTRDLTPEEYAAADKAREAKRLSKQIALGESLMAAAKSPAVRERIQAQLDTLKAKQGEGATQAAPAPVPTRTPREQAPAPSPEATRRAAEYQPPREQAPPRAQEAPRAGEATEAPRPAIEAPASEPYRIPERVEHGDLSHIDPTDHINLRRLNLPEEEIGKIGRLAQEWVAENGDAHKQRVTHEDIKAEAANIAPAAVANLARDFKGVALDPAMRYAARQRLNDVSSELVAVEKELRRVQGDTSAGTAEQVQRLTARSMELDRTAKGLLDVLIPTRSQDGRNLAFHAIMAARSFDEDYWIARARRVSGMPEAPREMNIRAALAKGREASTTLGDIRQQLEGHGVKVDLEKEAARLERAPKPSRFAALVQRFLDAVRPLVMNEAGEFQLFGARRRGSIRFGRASEEAKGTDTQGVRDSLAELARVKSELANHPDPQVRELIDRGLEAAREVRRARVELAREMATMQQDGLATTLGELFKAGLLTSPRTLVKVSASHVALQGIESAARLPAWGVDLAMSMITKQRSVGANNPFAAAESIKQSMGRGMVESGQILKHGMTDEEAAALSLPRELNSNVPVLGPIANAAVRAVYRAHGAVYHPFKVYAHEYALHEQARLEAINYAKQHPGADVEALTRQNLASPSEAMQAEALLAGQIATFSEPNRWSDAIGKGRGALSGPEKFLLDLNLPFKHVPLNVIGKVLDYAVVGGLYRAANVGAQMIARGKRGEAWGLTVPEQRMIAQSLGRGAVGAGLIYMGYRMAQAGMMTGTYEQKGYAMGEAMGQTPTSIKIDGRWLNIGDTLSPFGNMLVIGADLARAEKEQHVNPLAAVGPEAVKTALEMPMMQGVQHLQDLKADPAKGAMKFAGQLAGSIVPTGLGDLAKATDPATGERATSKQGAAALYQPIMAKIPGLREQLPIKPDIGGREVQHVGGPSALLNPFGGRQDLEEQRPGLAEVKRLAEGNQFQPDNLKVNIQPVKALKDHGLPVQLTEDQQRQMQSFRGQALEVRLNQAVASPAYRAATDDQRAAELHRIIKETNGDAREAFKGTPAYAAQAQQAYQKYQSNRPGAVPAGATTSLRDQLLRQSAGASF